MHNRDYNEEISKLNFYSPTSPMLKWNCILLKSSLRYEDPSMHKWSPLVYGIRVLCVQHLTDINVGKLNNILQNQQIIFGIVILVKWRFNSIKGRTSCAVRSEPMSSKAQVGCKRKNVTKSFS